MERLLTEAHPSIVFAGEAARCRAGLQGRASVLTRYNNYLKKAYCLMPQRSQKRVVAFEIHSGFELPVLLSKAKRSLWMFRSVSSK
jgi:hypothetical protein